MTAPKKTAPHGGGPLVRLLKSATPAQAKEVVRPVLRGVGLATSASRAHPDFLIIGAKRGGTTSLIKYLQLHPAILPMWPTVENNKKTHYFDRNYHRSDAWYRAHFPSNRQREHVERRLGVRPLTGEAAPYYMFHPLVLEHVLETKPDMKVLVLLRDPVDRVWSHYNERRQAGTETLGFEDALEAESGRLAGEEDRIRRDPRYYSVRHDFGSYLARGRYLEHLGPWLDAFEPSGRIHVIRSEDMYAEPQETLGSVHEFLGLPVVPPPAPHRYNYAPAGRPDSSTEAWLADYYRPHVEALEHRLERQFHWRHFDEPDATTSR